MERKIELTVEAYVVLLGWRTLAQTLAPKVGKNFDPKAFEDIIIKGWNDGNKGR